MILIYDSLVSRFFIGTYEHPETIRIVFEQKVGTTSDDDARSPLCQIADYPAFRDKDGVVLRQFHLGQNTASFSENFSIIDFGLYPSSSAALSTMLLSYKEMPSAAASFSPIS